MKDPSTYNVLDTSNLGGVAKRPHIKNFFNAIKTREKPHSDVLTGFKSPLIIQLGNIAQRVGRSWKIDSRNGHVINDPEANTFWPREFEQDWEIKL